MNENSKITVGIINYQQAQLSAVHGLADLFRLADSIHQKNRNSPSDLCLEVEIIDSVHQADALRLTAIIVPPSLEERTAVADEEIVSWLRDMHDSGVLVCSVCAGAILLAQTGLLDNRPATTHWAMANQFRLDYPAVQLDVDKLIIDDGDIITAGGLMAWVDLGLRMVDRFLGPSIMIATARYLLVDPSGREQSFYSVFSPSLKHGDAAILKTQHWLQARYAQPLMVKEMAEYAGLNSRTFLRRFHHATGFNPSDYLQHLRIGKARSLLELSGPNVDEIAWQVGYIDTSSFRRTFYKIVGLTPRDYRYRFTAPQYSAETD